MQVRVTKDGCSIQGKRRTVGEVVEVRESLAKEILGKQLAVPAAPSESQTKAD